VKAKRDEISDVTAKIRMALGCRPPETQAGCRVTFRYIQQVLRDTPVDDVFIQTAVNVWLCQSVDSPAPAAVAASTPTCPSPSGTVAGSITPAKVLALASQGFPGGDDGFDALLAALGSDAIYVQTSTRIDSRRERFAVRSATATTTSTEDSRLAIEQPAR